MIELIVKIKSVYANISGKSSPLFPIFIFLLLGLFITVIFAPRLTPRDPFEQNIGLRSSPPSLQHPMGTDLYGRDILSRFILGTRPTVVIAISAIALAVAVGVPLGLISGYRGDTVDAIIMWIADVLLSFPSYVMGVLVTAALGAGMYKAIIAIGLVYVARYIRLVRGSTLSVKEKDYVTASRACGAGALRILYFHILRNVSSEVIVSTTVWVGAAMLIAAGLSFLGLGAQPPMPSWGTMLKAGVDHIFSTTCLAIFPGLGITFAALLFNFIGDELQDYLNPKFKREKTI